MKLSVILLTIFFLNHLANAQEPFKVPRFTKTAIGNSGCFAYIPDDKTEHKFEISYSPDSSKIYSGTIPYGGFNYSLIVVKMKDMNLETQESKESMITSYLDFLKSEFEIVQFAGYGKGHTLESSPEAIGIIDYWEDKDKDQWAIKSWADASTLAVLMVYGPKEYPNANTLNLFLNGFRFK